VAFSWSGCHLIATNGGYNVTTGDLNMALTAKTAALPQHIQDWLTEFGLNVVLKNAAGGVPDEQKDKVMQMRYAELLKGQKQSSIMYRPR
jgi:hypothetical protein